MPRRKDGSYVLPALTDHEREIITIMQYDAKFGKFVDKDVWVVKERNHEPFVFTAKEFDHDQIQDH